MGEDLSQIPALQALVAPEDYPEEPTGVRNEVYATGTCSETHTLICSQGSTNKFPLDFSPPYYQENVQTYNKVKRIL